MYEMVALQTLQNKKKKYVEKKAAKRGHALKLNTLIRKMSGKMLLRK